MLETLPCSGGGIRPDAAVAEKKPRRGEEECSKRIPS
jgi:hypothetical protein